MEMRCYGAALPAILQDISFLNTATDHATTLHSIQVPITPFGTLERGGLPDFRATEALRLAPPSESND